MPSWSKQADLNIGLDPVKHELTEMLAERYERYGSDNILKIGFEGIKSRLIDKFARLENSTSRGDSEAMKEDINDIWGYATIASMLLRGRWPGQQNPAKPAQLELPLEDNWVSLVYLAGPIAGDESDHRNHWRDLVHGQLAKHGIGVLRPCTWAPEPVTEENEEQIWECDMRYIELCNVVLANFCPWVPSIGTAREIEYALKRRKRVIAVTPHYVPVSLCGCRQFRTLDEAIEFIVNLNR